MQDDKKLCAFWSQHLARALLASIPDDKLSGILKDAAEQAYPPKGDEVLDVRCRLEKRSRENRLLPFAIMRSWRETHEDVVAAADFMPIDGTPRHCAAILRQFSAESVLLELITDPHDDGWALAEWAVENVKNECVRSDLFNILRRWSEKRDVPIDGETTARKRFRIVVFGGHTRDENKMNRRLFENSPFQVRWKPFETNLGSPDARILEELMIGADAVLLVTTMVSHNIMRIVKRFTRKNVIPFRAIPKATDMHLISALADLFPETSFP